MDLKTAIVRASRFATTAKDPSPPAYTNIRFLPPANPRDPARVFATNGMLGILLTLDAGIDVLNTCAPAHLCAQMAKESDAILEMKWEGKAIEVTTRAKKTGATYRYLIPANPITNYPSFQTPPTPPKYIADWPVAQSVVHAAGGKDTDNDVYRCVRFLENTVEATDRYRVARADVETNCEGLVPKELFAHWPKGDVYAMFSPVYAFFQIGDELRYSLLVQGKFTDTRLVVPEDHNGASAICAVDPLTRAVSQAIKMHKARAVYLTFQKAEVVVSCWTHIDTHQFIAALPSKCTEPAKVLVSGPNLLDSLRAMKTRRVVVGYGSEQSDVLRLESGRVTICLWPMLVTTTEAHDGRQTPSS